MGILKRISLSVVFLFICLSFSVPVWSYTINSGAILVGDVDTFLASGYVSPSDPTTEEAWVEAELLILGTTIDLDWANKIDPVPVSEWTLVDGETTIFALELNAPADYFLLKIGSDPSGRSHFLFDNSISGPLYAVINTLDMYTYDNVSVSFALQDISHVTYNGTPVPEPATMALFGLGLIGIAGIGRKTRKK